LAAANQPKITAQTGKNQFSLFVRCALWRSIVRLKHNTSANNKPKVKIDE
jgi:hypothetical protein